MTKRKIRKEGGWVEERKENSTIALQWLRNRSPDSERISLGILNLNHLVLVLVKLLNALKL